MRSNALGRLSLTVAALSLLAAPTYAAGPLSFLCEGDHVVRAACCCPGAHHSSPDASVSAPRCCRVYRNDTSNTRALTSRPAAQADAVLTLAPTTVVAGDFLIAGAQVWPATRLAHPPPRAVPILLGKQSFLA
jgi:hypothetical protein